MRKHLVAVAMMSFCAALASAPAAAHHVSVDFGPVFGPGSDGDDFGTATAGDGTACTVGSSGPESCPLTLINNASTAKAIPLGFSIDFGTGPVDSLFINENGIVSFTGPITTSSFASLASVGQPVIAPFFADLTSVEFVGTVFEMSGTNFGQLMYQRGSAAAQPRSDGFNPADEVPAFAVLWYGPTDANGVQVFAQLVIYSHASSGAGDFDIGIRYGLNDGDQYNTGAGGATGIAGLLLGTNTLTITGPLAATTDYFYSVRGGKLVGGVTPPPPLTLACPAATAQVATAYSSALTAAGGVTPYTFSNTGSLPSGLQLNTSSGAVTGTPSAAGSFAFTAQVVDASGLVAGTVTTSCAITVTPVVAQVSLKVTPTSVSFGTVSRFSLQSRTVTLTNTGKAPVSLSRASVTPTGTARGDFAALSLCGPSLAVGKSCPIFVILFAVDVGPVTAILNIPNNATGSPQAIPLSVVVTPLRH